MNIPLLFKVLFGLIFITLLVSCSSSRKWKKKFDGPIMFGSYGGFAGSFDEYYIYDNGDIFHKKNLKADPQKIMTIKDDLKEEIFKTIIDQKLFEESIDEPGNMTYFLKFTHNGETCDLKWGGQYDPSQKLLEYHNFLGKHINARNPTM